MASLPQPPAGSSRRQQHRSPQLSSPDLLGSSPEFGEFESARANIRDTYSGDPPRSSFHHDHPPGNGEIDLLGDEPLATVQSMPWPPDHKPLGIQLPPRPTEISPDYVPPFRSPRRLSQVFSFTGPGSPPQVSAVEGDILFHSTSSQGNKGAYSSRLSTYQELDQRGTATKDDSLVASSPAHTKLFNTLATTKLGSKWKSALDHGASSIARIQPPVTHKTTLHSSLDSEHGQNTTALHIDINHTTPFMSSETVVGSYIPPSGAPGFKPETKSIPTTSAAPEDWSGTRLLERRETTAHVLTNTDADKLRAQLPPRQRLSQRWTLIFSLDQHGASLSTLYRLSEKYSSTNRLAGSVLVIHDGQDQKFGAYMNDAIIKREGAYYGGGESFMFKLQGLGHPIKTFRWTGKNQYFALCESDFISFGGGNGAYGLVLDSRFVHNSTATCPTFDNEVLSAQQPVWSGEAHTFECLGFELWGTL